MQKHLSKDYELCKKLSNTYRYIDDITIINASESFRINIHNIYPSSLQLVKVNNDDVYAEVLDLEISIKRNGEANIRIFDKRNNFSFHIINFPNACSNISINVGFNVFACSIKRILDICNQQHIAMSTIKDTFMKMINNQYDRNQLLNILNKYVDHKKIRKYKICDRNE